MRRGVETIAAGRKERPYGIFTSYVAFDRTDEEQLKRALDEVKPDVLLDLACYQPVEVESVIRNFKGDRYVFVSTGVYPNLNGKPAREEDFVPLEGEPPASLPVRQKNGTGHRPLSPRPGGACAGGGVVPPSASAMPTAGIRSDSQDACNAAGCGVDVDKQSAPRLVGRGCSQVRRNSRDNAGVVASDRDDRDARFYRCDVQIKRSVTL